MYKTGKKIIRKQNIKTRKIERERRKEDERKKGINDKTNTQNMDEYIGHGKE